MLRYWGHGKPFDACVDDVDGCHLPSHLRSRGSQEIWRAGLPKAEHRTDPEAKRDVAMKAWMVQFELKQYMLVSHRLLGWCKVRVDDI